MFRNRSLLFFMVISLIITWLFLASGESVLVVTLFHAVFNTMAQVIPTQDAELLLAISAGLMWLVAVFLIVRYGPKLSRSTLEAMLG